MGQENAKGILPWSSDELLPGDQVSLRGKELAANPHLQGLHTVNSVDGKKLRLEGISERTFTVGDVKLIHGPHTRTRRQIYKLLLTYVNSCRDYNRPPIQKVVNTLSTALRHARLPEKLDICGENVHDEDCGPLFVFVHPTLWFKSIDLSYNKIGPYGGAALGQALCKCRRCPTEIILRGNPLSPDGVFDLAELLHTSRDLLHLDVADTQIGKLGVMEILQKLKSTPSSPLQVLNLERNNAQDKEVRLLYHTLEHCEALQRVTIYPPNGTYEGANPLFRAAMSDKEIEIEKARKKENQVMLQGLSTDAGPAFDEGSRRGEDPDTAGASARVSISGVSPGDVEFVRSMLITADSVSMKNEDLQDFVRKYPVEVLEKVVGILIEENLQKNARALSFLNVMIHKIWREQKKQGQAPARVVTEWLTERKAWHAWDKVLDTLLRRELEMARQASGSEDGGKMKAPWSPGEADPRRISMGSSASTPRKPDGSMPPTPGSAGGGSGSMMMMSMKVDQLEGSFRSLVQKTHGSGGEGGSFDVDMERNFKNVLKSVEKLMGEGVDEVLAARISGLREEVMTALTKAQEHRSEALKAELVDMFPMMPQSTLMQTLADCNGHMEVAIDRLLQMIPDDDGGAEEPAGDEDHVAAAETAQHVAHPGYGESDYEDDDEYDDEMQRSIAAADGHMSTYGPEEEYMEEYEPPEYGDPEYWRAYEERDSTSEDEAPLQRQTQYGLVDLPDVDVSSEDEDEGLEMRARRY